MVARPGTERTNFNSGEISVELYDRTDVKTWYSGAAVMDGFEPVPQGGYAQLPRTRHRSFGGRQLTMIAVSTPAVVAGVVAAQLLVEIDLGVSGPVAAIDLAGFLATHAVDDALTVNVSAVTGVDGTVIAPALDVAIAAHVRRIAFPPGAPVTGRYVRIRCVAVPASSTDFTLGAVTAYAESFGLVARLKSFGVTRDAAYVVSLGPGHADIFKAGAYVGCASLPYDAGQVLDAALTQRFDTGLLWHEDVKPARLLHVSGDADWKTDDAPFENIPLVDLGGIYTNGVAEIWAIYYSYTGSGDDVATSTFTVNVNGEETEPVAIAGTLTAGGADFPGTAADLQAALNALPSVAGGVTVTGANGNRVGTFTVTFGGANVGDSFILAGKALSGLTTAAVTVGRQRRGIKPGEAIMSAGRGYPRTGVFFQDRLWLAGFKSESGAYVMSAPGEYYNLNTLIEAASGPILDRLDVDGAEKIMALVKSKQLVSFTDAANRWLTNRAITRTDPRNWSFSTNDGVAPGVPVIESEGSLLFVNPERTMLMAATYSEVSQGYDVAPISLLASHLIDQVRDMALQKPRQETDSQRLYLPREDGLLVIGLLIRNQDITAFVRWSTDGSVRSVAVDAAGQASLLVQRAIDGVQRLVYETMEAELLFDQAVSVSLETPATIVPGLEVLEGATVWADCDGYMEGPYTVDGGAITVTQPGLNFTVGRWRPPTLTTLPLSKVINNQVIVLQRPCRVHTVRLKLLESTSLAVGANGGAARAQPLARFGGPVDQPLAPWSGDLVVAGLSGFTPQGQVTITQLKPGRLQVRSQTVEAKT